MNKANRKQNKNNSLKWIFLFLPILLLFTIPVSTQTVCPSPYPSYASGLASLNTSGPADLINQSSIETEHNKYNLSYDLVNVGSDIKKVTIQLLRLYEETEDNNNGQSENPWKVEETIILNPPFATSTSIVFNELKKGKTYDITLAVTSSFLSLLFGEPYPDQEITLKSIEFLWPKDQFLRASIENRIEREDGSQKFIARWDGVNATGGYNFKASHSDGSINPLVGHITQKEIVFTYNEFQNYSPSTISSFTTEALNGNGQIQSNVTINVSKCPPFCPIPVCPPSPPPIGSRNGTIASTIASITETSSTDDFSDDAGSTAVHFISKIPASSIVVRKGCRGLWENTTAANLMVGDEMMLITKFRNIDNNKHRLMWGGICSDSSGTSYFATVSEIQTGTIPTGTPYWFVCSKARSGGVYCTSLIDGKYASFENYPSDNPLNCNIYTIPVHYKFKSPENLATSDGIWWLDDLAFDGTLNCSHICCTLSDDNCDCGGFLFDCPDRFYSATLIGGTTTAPKYWISLKIALPPELITIPNSVKNWLGSGTWKIKIGVPIQGDYWTARTNPFIDMVGHSVGMDKYILNVP